MNEKIFSVAMCVYKKDNPKWFEIAVESVLNQTIMPSEIVLIVDGPVPDELDTVIKRYEKMEIFKVIRFTENQGHGNARRRGIIACSNELVALMDADDICVSNRFEKQLVIFSTDNSIDLVGGNIIEFVENPDNPVAKRIVPESDMEIKEYMKKRCPINQMTVMFKKSSVEQVGNYVDWYCNEDYYLWIRMALANMNFFNINDTLVRVRVGKEMYRRRGGKKYFFSEFKLQKYMFNNHIIRLDTFLVNILKRFIVQILLPNTIRGWVFKTFARKKV